MIKVSINGAQGRLGQIACQAVRESSDMALVGELGKHDDLLAHLQQQQPDVVINVVPASMALETTLAIVNAGTKVIVGSSGLTEADVLRLAEICQQKKLGAIVAPNFSIGAILMMKFSKIAAKYFNFAEIVEYHHEKKQDAPSGTAIKTAEIIASEQSVIQTEDREIVPGARGGKHQQIPIHSIRMPGYLAHQEVIFSGSDELLKIKHDTSSRKVYSAGVLLAARAIIDLNSLVCGLDELVE